MKKIILFFALIFMSLAVLTSCSKSKTQPIDDCSAPYDKWQDEYLKYSLSVGTPQESAKCKELKTATNNFLACPSITPTQKSTIQSTMALLTCP